MFIGRNEKMPPVTTEAFHIILICQHIIVASSDTKIYAASPSPTLKLAADIDSDR